jgi:hypothetical protein
MKKLFITLALVLFSSVAMAGAPRCQALSDFGLSNRQIDVMYQSFQYGKERNWGLTLAAIAFKESSAGNPNFMRNPNDPSAGFHGVKLTHVMTYFDMPDTANNRAIAEDMLISSHGASAWFSMSVLDYWFKYHKGDWYKTVRSYNGGFYWWSSRPEEVRVRTQEYFNDVNHMVRLLKTCSWK